MAEEAVNRESMKNCYVPLVEDIGRQRRNALVRVIITKPRASDLTCVILRAKPEGGKLPEISHFVEKGFPPGGLSVRGRGKVRAL